MIRKITAASIMILSCSSTNTSHLIESDASFQSSDAAGEETLTPDSADGSTDRSPIDAGFDTRIEDSGPDVDAGDTCVYHCFGPIRTGEGWIFNECGCTCTAKFVCDYGEEFHCTDFGCPPRG